VPPADAGLLPQPLMNGYSAYQKKLVENAFNVTFFVIL
jgi:hypothetical protein